MNNRTSLAKAPNELKADRAQCVVVERPDHHYGDDLVFSLQHFFYPLLYLSILFVSGDVIEILIRTDTPNDWWEGVSVDGKRGIFPANYVQLI